MHTSLTDRISGGLAAATAVGAIGAALFFGLAVDRTVPHEQQETILDLAPHEQPRPPRPRPPPKHRERRAAAAPAPPNLRNKATDVVAPVPLVVAPIVPVPTVTAPVANTGSAAETGSSDQAGPGTGAGGSGAGTGGGGTGNGDERPPRQRKGRLRFADLPPALRAAGVQGRVEVRYAVEPDGHVGACSATASSGDAVLDAATCRLIQQKFLFDPARDGDGRPVRSTIVESHSWIIVREEDPPRP